MPMWWGNAKREMGLTSWKKTTIIVESEYNNINEREAKKTTLNTHTDTK